jgi:hypothetical protein
VIFQQALFDQAINQARLGISRLKKPPGIINALAWDERITLK